MVFFVESILIQRFIIAQDGVAVKSLSGATTHPTDNRTEVVTHDVENVTVVQ